MAIVPEDLTATKIMSLRGRTSMLVELDRGWGQSQGLLGPGLAGNSSKIRTL